MTRRQYILALISMALGATLVLLIAYCSTQRPRLSINSEFAKLMLLEGGYRSWTIRYSNGHQFDGHEWKNLWIWPVFEHADIRPILEYERLHPTP